MERMLILLCSVVYLILGKIVANIKWWTFGYDVGDSEVIVALLWPAYVVWGIISFIADLICP